MMRPRVALIAARSINYQNRSEFRSGFLTKEKAPPKAGQNGLAFWLEPGFSFFDLLFSFFNHWRDDFGNDDFRGDKNGHFLFLGSLG